MSLKMNTPIIKTRKKQRIKQEKKRKRKETVQNK